LEEGAGADAEGSRPGRGNRPRGPAPAPEETLHPLLPPEGVDLVEAHESLDRHFFGEALRLTEGNETAQRSFSGSTTTRSGTGGKSWDFDPARKWKIFEIVEAIWKY